MTDAKDLFARLFGPKGPIDWMDNYGKGDDNMRKSSTETVEHCDTNCPLKAELAELKADYQRLKERAAKGSNEAVNNALKGFALSMVSVLDSIEEGLRMGEGSLLPIQKQFVGRLKECGVTAALTCTGDPFDHRRHEAVGVVETDEVEEDHIAEVVRTGYCLVKPYGFPSEVIRPALVKTAVKPKSTPTFKECL